MSYDFDLIVIGGGAAGLVASKFAAGMGKKVAIVEKDKIGGECTHYGCVPSKTLIKTAKMLNRMGRLDEIGLKYGEKSPVVRNDVMGHVRHTVERIYQGHRPEVLERQGIHVVSGDGHFRDNHSFTVNGKTLSTASFVICTGSSAFVPPIAGIGTVPYMTNDTLFEMKGLPRSMIILGGGPIGIEMAQALNYLGVVVTVIEMGDQVLIREDKEMRDLLSERLRAQGLSLQTGAKAVKIGENNGFLAVTVENALGEQSIVSADTVLVAVGRKANVEGLDLEAAGVEYSQKNIKTDEKLQTTAGNIYACGDVVGPYQFSHMAEYQARIAARNALFPFKARANYDHYIWCTFTDPEFAHAGMTEEEARQRYGDKVKIYRWQYTDTDRARTEADEWGMSKFICDRSYRLLGAHILGARAGELIHEAQILKTLGIPLTKLDSVIHVYPTFSDVIRQPAKMARIDSLLTNPAVRFLSRLVGSKKR
jgi:pyruvate/2-oxoglutarate dehydrogenase complex dihydrolipoamide dehydrogenase (E3) component